MVVSRGFSGGSQNRAVLRTAAKFVFGIPYGRHVLIIDGDGRFFNGIQPDTLFSCGAGWTDEPISVNLGSWKGFLRQSRGHSPPIVSVRAVEPYAPRSSFPVGQAF